LHAEMSSVQKEGSKLTAFLALFSGLTLDMMMSGL
jgi:hypothetical protein